jgi:predicted Zn-dependent peptidase
VQFRQHRLANGLEIIAECNPGAYSTAIAFFVNTGSRDESDELWGVSHFLEHMVFKGTPRRTSVDVNRELDEIGSHSNAFTSEEHTVYYATVLPEYQTRAVDLLADILRPSLREADFDMEKQVILEEIAKYEDQPPFGAADKCMAAHFQRHPLGRSVLGTTASVGALTPVQMRRYFSERYSPGNIVLVAAGNVDFERLIADAEKCCGEWEPFRTDRLAPRAPAASRTQVIRKESAAQQYIVQIANGPAAEDENRHASRLLATILGDDSGSRLFWELIDTGLAEHASMGTCEFQGSGIYMTFVCCAPDDAQANLECILEVQREAEQRGVSEDELQRAKSKVGSQIVLYSERPSNRLFSVGNNWLQRREYRTVRETVACYDRVTQQDIREVLEQFPLTTRTTVAVGPLSQMHLPD